MKAAVHIVPAAGVELDKANNTGRSGTAGSGMATAALQTCDKLDQPVDLVLIAVPAGTAQNFVRQLFENGEADARG